MRVLGVDPGLIVTGYGVVREDNHTLHFVGAGAIKPPPRIELAKRLRIIFDGLTQVVQDFRPDAIAVEETFLSKNFAAALRLGQSCGVAILAAELSGLKVFQYTPSEVKLAVVGHGAAGKQQVQSMVGHLLSKPASEWAKRNGSHHATDALAIAICHLHSRNIRAIAQSHGRFG